MTFYEELHMRCPLVTSKELRYSLEIRKCVDALVFA
jgi:hypothetical protein